MIVDGVVSYPIITFQEIGTSSGIFSAAFTPTSTGVYYWFIEGDTSHNLQPFRVVTRNVYSFLQNLEDESIGSWTWDKTTGALTLLRQDASQLATFQVTDTLNSASRERLT